MASRKTHSTGKVTPRTAAAVGLPNPFDPREALPASARLLGGLFQRFGNLGLAAAAYNAGEARVSNWLSNKSGLPQETRNYVLAITGFPVEHWKAAARGLQSFKLAKRMPCRDHEAFAEADNTLEEAGATDVPATKAALSTESAQAERATANSSAPAGSMVSLTCADAIAAGGSAWSRQSVAIRGCRIAKAARSPAMWAATSRR